MEVVAPKKRGKLVHLKLEMASVSWSNRSSTSMGSLLKCSFSFSFSLEFLQLFPLFPFLEVFAVAVNWKSSSESMMVVVTLSGDESSFSIGMDLVKVDLKSTVLCFGRACVGKLKKGAS